MFMLNPVLSKKIITYTRAIFLLTFRHFECGRGKTGLTPKKYIVFSGKIKVGPKCPTFIRGDPYEPHKPPKKVNFSYF